jgi:hypothetical protein
MSTIPGAKKVAFAALGLAMLAPVAAPFAPAASAAGVFADPALEKVWSRTDKPIEDRVAVRSWMWGPETFYSSYEAYIEGPNGQHLVSYFDKSRMEINNPNADRNAQWYVTNGLLVVDMMSGRIQTGNSQFIQSTPADVAVAGDGAGSLDTPTYASLARVASLTGNNRAPNRTGQSVREGIGRSGGVGVLDNLSGFARYAVYEPTLGHNIPDVFWSYLNSQGIVYENGRYVNGTVVDWLFAMGYPITEPYWIKIKVGPQERWVLMQAFQRRILTYSPFNPEGWKVEMGNVGRAYYDWRYKGSAPAPTPTATPAPRPAGSISINPANGSATTTITITGKNFPPGAPVLIGIENPTANYFRNLGTVAAKADGSFVTQIILPSDAARYGELVVTATANAGAIRSTQTYRVDHSPQVVVSPNEVVTNGTIRVQGEGFPASANVNIGLQFPDRDVEWIARTRTNIEGSFDSTVAIDKRPAGSAFKVIAAADGGYKATSAISVRVIGQPSLQVQPNSGPSGVTVTLRGAGWPANRAISLGLRATDNPTEVWTPNQIVSDGAGNFSAAVFIGREYTEKSEVRLIAFESVSMIRMESSYRITRDEPNPPPAEARVSVNPSVLAIGQVATVTGSNWQAAGVVSIGVGRPGFGVEEWLVSVRADGSRNFSVNIALGPRWQNAGQLVLTATIPNSKTATTLITVVASAGRITPGGLPLTVDTYTRGNSTQYRLKGDGWRPGSVVNVSVVSGDGSVNAQVATATVGDEGRFGATFNATAPWAGRGDLGVRASTLDGQQYSLRYLHTTSLAKVGGTNNTYNLAGYNWPAGSELEVVVATDEGSAGVITTVTTDANGAFNVNVNLPRIPGKAKNDVQIRAKAQPYSATFDF